MERIITTSLIRLASKSLKVTDEERFDERYIQRQSERYCEDGCVSMN